MGRAMPRRVASYNRNGTGTCYQRREGCTHSFPPVLTLEPPEELLDPMVTGLLGQCPMNSPPLTTKELLGLWMVVPW